MAGKNEARAYQKISDGVYRVSGTVRRSAVTGRYLIEGSRGSSSARNTVKKSSTTSEKRS